MTQNTWTHFALSRTGTTIRVFKNGVMVDSTVNASMTTILWWWETIIYWSHESK